MISEIEKEQSMNAHQTNVQPDLPGMSEVIGCEIKMLQEDVERVRSLRDQCAGMKAKTDAEMDALLQRWKQKKAAANDLNHRITALDRMLAARKRVLFEMEQEAS